MVNIMDFGACILDAIGCYIHKLLLAISQLLQVADTTMTLSRCNTSERIIPFLVHFEVVQTPLRVHVV